MNNIKIIIAFILCSISSAIAQIQLTQTDSDNALEDIIKDTAIGTKPTNNSLVSILGYHDFTTNQKSTEMLIHIDIFRKQMQTIKDLGLKVITLEEFIAWKTENLNLPERSILITIDDGWKSVYEYAYPILKEFEYPFTLFLYKNYLNGGSKALTTTMVREMIENGASIGSHSVSHPLPSSVKKMRQSNSEAYKKFLVSEFAVSKKFLASEFKAAVTSYAYPGGFHTPEMYPIAKSLGYNCLFTVIPGKVSKNSPNQSLPRYIILGNHDSIFEKATRFPATTKQVESLGAMQQLITYPVNPAAGSVIDDRLPLLSIDLDKVMHLDPTSLTMHVSGFGYVPAKFNPKTKLFSWKTNRRLRKSSHEITVSWKLMNHDNYEKPVQWIFVTNKRSAYLSTDNTAEIMSPKK